MVIHKYINKLVNSFEKHVRVFRKACTCFSENMYVFWAKYVGTYIAPLKIYNKYILISLLFSIFVIPPTAAQVNERGDSVIVIKGQVSDYYITVSQKHFLEGTITGPDGKPLEGATVMFTASPVHLPPMRQAIIRYKQAATIMSYSCIIRG